MMSDYKRKRKIRKIKARVYTVVLAPYFLTHFAISWIIFKIKPLFQKKEKLKNIINGWSNYMVEDPVVEAVALQRAKICSKCPFAVEMSIKLKEKNLKNIKGMKCNRCGCPLSAKTRSLNDNCPIGKWPAINIK